MNAVDKIYFNFSILYKKMVDEKQLSTGYCVKSNDKFPFVKLDLKLYVDFLSKIAYNLNHNI